MRTLAPRQLWQMLKVRVRRAENEVVLDDERRDPKIIDRDGGRFATELKIKLRVMMSGLLIGKKNGNTWTVEETLEVSGIGGSLISGGETGSQFAEHNERQVNFSGRPDNMDAGCFAAHEVTIRVRV
jgi:hypothetical protein